MWFFNFDWSPAVVMYSCANYFLCLRREANPGASRALIRGLGCKISVFLIFFTEKVFMVGLFFRPLYFILLGQHGWTLVRRSKK